MGAIKNYCIPDHLRRWIRSDNVDGTFGTTRITVYAFLCAF